MTSAARREVGSDSLVSDKGGSAGAVRAEELTTFSWPSAAVQQPGKCSGRPVHQPVPGRAAVTRPHHADPDATQARCGTRSVSGRGFGRFPSDGRAKVDLISRPSEVGGRVLGSRRERCSACSNRTGFRVLRPGGAVGMHAAVTEG